MKRREFWNSILTLAIAALVVAWLSFAWTAMTGLTVTSRSVPGRVANEADRTRTRTLVVFTTALAVPVALLAAMQRKRG